MRALVLLPIAILLAAACGLAFCSAFDIFDIASHQREMIAATLICLCAGELAVVPLVLSRRGSQIAAVQLALVGSIVHLFFCIATAMILVVARVVIAQPFLFWMLGLYWVSLIVLVIAFARAIRSAAPMAQAPRQ